MFELGVENGRFYSLNVPLRDGIDDQGRSQSQGNIGIIHTSYSNVTSLCIPLLYNDAPQLRDSIVLSMLCEPAVFIHLRILLYLHAHFFLSSGYANLFKPIMQTVVNHYQPSCIVLQVSFKIRARLLITCISLIIFTSS